jgi:hypothetical protein
VVEMIKSFKAFINDVKLSHIEHLEDLVYQKSGKDLVRDLYTLINSLSTGKGMTWQAKLDGAPAIIAGTNPENGKFFVATKSLFNKTPKINYTASDVDNNHKGELAVKLKQALAHLESVIPKGKIVQGDFMFSKSDIKTQMIDGKKYYTFKPNTLLYAIPVDTPLGKEIASSTIGVGWHTTYTGKTIADLSANFIIDISKFKKSTKTWNIDTNVNDMSEAMISDKEKKELIIMVKKMESGFKRGSFKDLRKDKELLLFISTYYNQLVRENSLIASFDGLLRFINDKYEGKINKLKTDKAKGKKIHEKDTLIERVRKDKSNINRLFSIHSDIVAFKTRIMSQLERLKRFKVFVDTPTGLKISKEEGFVAITGGNVIKLVDRLDFSRNNFILQKSWG